MKVWLGNRLWLTLFAFYFIAHIQGGLVQVGPFKNMAACENGRAAAIAEDVQASQCFPDK